MKLKTVQKIGGNLPIVCNRKAICSSLFDNRPAQSAGAQNFTSLLVTGR